MTATRFISLAAICIAIGFAQSPIPLPSGVIAKTIAVITITCVMRQSGIDITGEPCTQETNNPQFLGLIIGNNADSKGYMYGTVLPPLGVSVTSTQLYATSPDGISKIILTIPTNQTCAGGGTQGTMSSRSVVSLGYNLGAQALYVAVSDISRTMALVAPTNGYTLDCSAGGLLQISQPNGKAFPATTTTTVTKNSYLKLTGKLIPDENEHGR